MKNAVIKEIELINYRLFKKAKLEFKPSAKKNICIVEGTNGFGKSNIFNAINWCFYGIEPHLRKDSVKLPICNTTVLEKLKKDEPVRVIIRITLDTAGGEKKIERSQMFYKTGPSTHYTNDSKLVVMEQVGRQWKEAPNPGYVISRILPESMRHFFFIDGEMLREMFEHISSDKIKDAIFDLSQVTLLQRAIDHLDSFSGIVRREGGAGQDEYVQMAEERLKKIEDEMSECTRDLQKFKEAGAEAKINIQKLGAEIEKVDIKSVQVYEEQRKGLVHKIEADEKTLAEAREQLRSQLLESAPAIVLHDSIEKCLEVLVSLKKKNKLPAEYQKTFIERLLKDKECICGSDLADAGQACVKKLKALLADCEEVEFQDQGLKLLYSLQSMRASPEPILRKIAKAEKNIIDLESGLVDYNKALKEVELKIGETDVDKVKLLQKQREDYVSIRNESEGRASALTQQLSKLKHDKGEFDKALRRLLSKQEKYKALTAKLAACDSSMASFEAIKETLMRENRKETEANTQKYFKFLISQKQFSEPQIDENYNLIVKKNGYDAIHSLSAAETLCMGYAFMAALRKTSGFLAPIVIDTPLAKISEKYRANVATWIKENLSEAQFLLLVSDVEYTTDFRKSVDSVVADRYMLSHDKKEDYSEVTRDAN